MKYENVYLNIKPKYFYFRKIIENTLEFMKDVRNLNIKL